MTRSAIKTSNAPAPVGTYSQEVTSGDLLFISGQIPLDPENGELAGTLFSEQCHQVLANLKNILHAGGSSLGQVLKVKIFMTNLGQFGESKPARTYIEVSNLPKGVDIEIDAIAQISEVS